ncbi:DsbC family protein [Pelobacter propionicus]|uniref:Protein-disulfide isomerase n=1 Tax=Pelobacter propionicus (strain DSM 2379 / NBRC 103807 / OttBd1) TaxID=338966 RepID=A0R7R5_PELPD|nr:DsbC family protein [Pelobacter propionicus]ABL01373.1 protein-disulfide isomerase [Pelobacter propionicus DSM 2379]
MKRKTVAAGFALCAAVAGVGVGVIRAENKPDPNVARAIEELKKQLPNISAPQISESEIPGLFKLVAGQQIMYWSPGGYMIVGEMYDVKKGKNITAEQRQEIMKEYETVLSKKVQKMPLDNAVKIGNGKNVVIEFTDPDCPYCKKMGKFLDEQKNITRYVFLFPLKMHPNAHAKSAYVLSQTDKQEALKRVFSGEFDKKPVPEAIASAKDQVNKNIKLGEELGISGTPTVFVNGSLVRGVDFKRLKMLLESGQS